MTWWTDEDLAPPLRAIERGVQIEATPERAAHVRQTLLLRSRFWRGAALWLVIRTYEDGIQTAQEAWRTQR